MEFQYQKYPNSVRELAKEIIQISNDYKARRISHDILEDSILWYASECGDMLYKADDFSPTIKRMIGKWRLSILVKITSGHMLPNTQ